ncbi:MAG: hypothetical protein CL608_11500 [Anaerolineaceae bacterium]|nr:hypothetical protein [Anaerolineaceae bacterium]
MIGQYLNCYTLGCSAPAQERLDYVLPCSREQALQLFAMLIDKKTLLIPRRHPISVRVPNTMLSVCRVSSYTIASFLWRSGHLVRTNNRLSRFMDRVGYHLQLFRHLNRAEQTIDEVVLELFYSSQGQIPCVDLPDPNVHPEDVLLARLHFAEISPAQTMLRVFIGWTDSAPLEGLDELYGLLQRYMDLLYQVLLPDTLPTLPAENSLNGVACDTVRPLPEFVEVPECDAANDVAGHCNETAVVEANTAKVIITYADDKAPLAQPPDWQIQKVEEKDLLHSENRFRATEEGGDGNELEGLEEEDAQPEEEDNEDDPQPQTIPVPSEDELQLYRAMKPPRLYPQTLSNICIMVAERQRQIDETGVIPRMDTFDSRLVPSRNTFLKIPELVTHWHDIRYRWNVVTWLHHHSGHTEAEISEILSTLYYSLSKEAWAVVTSAGKEEDKTTENRRPHQAQDERDSREKGTGLH